MYIYISFSLMNAATMSPQKMEKEHVLAGDSVPASASQVSFAPVAAANSSSAASQAPLPSVCMQGTHTQRERERERERERDVFA
jgi:hypothetical protein